MIDFDGVVYFEDWLKENGYTLDRLSEDEEIELYDEFVEWAEAHGFEPQGC